MKMLYEKPDVEYIQICSEARIMDVGSYDDGWEDGGDEEPI